ncbi:hypothetical protein ES708_20068 [subsurface metagenome]
MKRWLDKRYERAGRNWTDEELDVLGEKYGLISDRALSHRLQRSPNALHIAAVRNLHSNRKMNFYSAAELAKVLGIPCSKTLIPWVKAKWIKARRSVVQAGEYRAWRFMDRNIQAFLRNKPWLFDPQKMPQHYFRAIVQEEYDKDPWYQCIEAAPLLGVGTEAVRRYIFHGWLKADKKPGGPWTGVWIIRRSEIERFLANDPRPRHRHDLASSSRKRLWRKAGNPLRLSTIWSVLCPTCGNTVVVKADPGLKGLEVQSIFTRVYSNGACSHGLVCTLEEPKRRAKV